MGAKAERVVQSPAMDAQLLDERNAPKLLPLNWMRRLVEGLDRDASEGASEILEKLESALRALADGPLDRAGCQAFLRERGDLLVGYFSLVATLVAKFGLPDPDVIVAEWSEASEALVSDGAVRQALQRTMDRLAEADGRSPAAELQAAMEAELTASGTSSPIDAFVSWRAELTVAFLAGAHLPPGREATYTDLLGVLCDGHDDARAKAVDHLFARLGRWKTPALPKAQERALWYLFGAAGIRLLLGRLWAEYDADRLDVAGEVLIALWPVSAGSMRTALEAALKRGDGDDLLVTLLRALRWVRPEDLRLPMDRALFEGLMQEALGHSNADARESSARALAAWRGAAAADVLRRRLRFERDADVLDVVLELVAEIAPESAA